MGKKKIKKQTEEELLKESEHVSSGAKPLESASVKIGRQIVRGRIYIQVSYNNTFITVTDEKGDVLAWSSAGSLGFKGPKKATPYAATQVVGALSEKVKKYGLKELEVFVKGIGSGREASIRALANNGFELTLIKDITSIPHNGCRPKKPRRV